MTYFFLLELALLTLPILAYLLYKNFPSNKKIILVLLCLISILGLGLYYDITFKGDFLDFLLPIFAYMTYCYSVFHILKVRNKFVKVFACFIASLPIAVGYLVATLGLLGLMMISLDFESHRTVDLGDNSYFREYGYGNATTDDGGLKIDVYKFLPWFPIFEKKIFSKNVSSMHYNTTDLKVKLIAHLDKYDIRIYSRDSLQIDTTVER